MTGRYLKSTDFVDFALGERIARITLNRPEKRNALNPAMITELHDALIEADALVDVNVILLAGAGRDFCAGYDLAGTYAGRTADAAAQADEAEAVKYRTLVGTLDDDSWQIERTQRELSVLFEIHKPVIAQVQGNCLAGGMDLALMCDMVIAAEDARFGFPAARANGTPPSNMWLYHLGPQWAKRLLMTGDCIWGRDAARLGMVLDAVPAADLDAAAGELARRVSLVDAELLAAHKRVVNLGLELGGARTLQRMASEFDARAHLSQGPRRKQFKADMAARGLKEALQNRDEPFGDGMIRIHWTSK
jgi:enoyl-CoA hydratase